MPWTYDSIAVVQMQGTDGCKSCPLGNMKSWQCSEQQILSNQMLLMSSGGRCSNTGYKFSIPRKRFDFISMNTSTVKVLSKVKVCRGGANLNSFLISILWANPGYKLGKGDACPDAHDPKGPINPH